MVWLIVNFKQVVGSAKAEPLRIMISGAPASGKGTQCQLITQKVSSHNYQILLKNAMPVFVFLNNFWHFQLPHPKKT